MNMRNDKGLLKALFFMMSVFSLPKLAFASGSESPVGEGLGYIVNSFVYGQDGIILATLAIAGVGLLCLSHHAEWKRFIQTIAGVAIIFGASAIVSGIKALVH